MEKPHQPSFLDNQGRPDSAVISQNTQHELEAKFKTPEQINRVRELMQEGLSVQEAAERLRQEDSDDKLDPYRSRK